MLAKTKTSVIRRKKLPGNKKSISTGLKRRRVSILQETAGVLRNSKNLPKNPAAWQRKIRAGW